eukprot:NODE_662_length_4925_cov_0.478243.p5 type:complete len:160 gc:universal NODE_662_length_4925_cov_0.478243:964-485(-)
MQVAKWKLLVFAPCSTFCQSLTSVISAINFHVIRILVFMRVAVWNLFSLASLSFCCDAFTSVQRHIFRGRINLNKIKHWTFIYSVREGMCFAKWAAHFIAFDTIDDCCAFLIIVIKLNINILRFMKMAIRRLLVIATVASFSNALASFQSFGTIFLILV